LSLVKYGRLRSSFTSFIVCLISLPGFFFLLSEPCPFGHGPETISQDHCDA